MRNQPNSHVRLAIAGLVLCLSASHTTHAATVSLFWENPNLSRSVVGYKVYYGTASREYTGSTNVGHLTRCTIERLDPSITHYFAIAAEDIHGNESDYSTELVWDNEAPTISGPEEIQQYPQGAGGFLMPDLTKQYVASDDFSPATSIALTQKPAPGSWLPDMPALVLLYAIDEAGNKASRVVPVIRQTTEGGCTDCPLRPAVAISLSDGKPTLSCTLPAKTSYKATLEWCSNLDKQEWIPVPDCENVPTEGQVIVYRPGSTTISFFRLRIQSE